MIYRVTNDRSLVSQEKSYGDDSMYYNFNSRDHEHVKHCRLVLEIHLGF